MIRHRTTIPLALAALAAACHGSGSGGGDGLDSALAGSIAVAEPAAGAVVDGHSAAMRADLRADLDPRTLTARLNGRDVTRHLRVAGATATGRVGGLLVGANELVFEARGLAGGRTRSTVAFTHAPRAIEDVPQTAAYSIAGLTGRVEALVDPWGIRHAYTVEDNPDDLVFMQGYAIALDRLFQLDLFRKAAQGRLTELFGTALDPSVLQRDVAMRTILTTREGERVEDVLAADLLTRAPDAHALLTRFVEGVNAYLDDLAAGRNGAVLPQQYETVNGIFALLGAADYEIEPMTVAQVLAIGRLQQWELSQSLDEELSRMRKWCAVDLAERAGALPPGTREDLFRAAPADLQVILPPGETGAVSAAERAPDAPALARPATLDRCEAFLARVERVSPILLEGRRLLSPPGARPGSNNWTIRDSMTASGFALVANDPHLSLGNPSILYPVHGDNKTFTDGEFNIAGLTFPGLPGILLGQNERVAWGGTVCGYDVTDIYMEDVTVHGDGTKTVRFRDADVPVRTVMETFRVRGGADLVIPIDVVPHHGPQVPDGDPTDDVAGIEGTGMSFRWTGHEVTREVEAFLYAITAEDVDDLRDAFANFGTGAQNWNGADVDGDILYFPHALIPLRAPGAVSPATPPYLPLPGTGEAEWETDAEGRPRFVPADEIPQARNPAQGFVVTANHDIAGTTVDNNPLDEAPYLYYSDAVGFRGGEIQEALQTESPGEMTLARTLEVQGSHRARLAARFMPWLLGGLANEAAYEGIDAATRAKIDAARARLADWDLRCPTGLPDAFTDEAPPAADVDSSIGASLFFVWLGRFSNLALDDEVAAGGGEVDTGTRIAALLHLLEDEGRTEPGRAIRTAGPGGASVLWDDLRTPEVEDRDRVVVRAMARAIEDLEGPVFGTADVAQWRWGEIHRLTLVLEGVGEVVEAFNLPSTDIVTQILAGPNPGYPRAGALFTVDVANHGLDLDFRTRSGPVMRMVVEMEPDVLTAWNVIPGGTSDLQPGTGLLAPVAVRPDLHYGDQLPLWLRNEYRPQLLFYEDVTRVATERWTFTPD